MAHIRKRGNLYEASVYNKYKGKCEYVSDPDKEQCEIKALELKLKIIKGIPILNSNTPLFDYLDEWIDGRNLKPSTKESYKDEIEQNIKTYFPNCKLRDLRPASISKSYEALERDKGAGVVHHAHPVLRKALNDAVSDEIIADNPALYARLPRKPKPKKIVWSVDQFLTAFDYLQDEENLRPGCPMTMREQMYAIGALAILEGVRRGEICAMKWSKFNFELCGAMIDTAASETKKQLLYVPPKSDAGIRFQYFDQSLIPVMMEHKRRQAEQRLMLGPDWPGGDWIFRKSNGDPLRPKSLSKRWGEFLDRHPDLPHATLHRLRTLYCTLNMQLGTPDSVNAAMLGHDDPQTTRRHYQIVLPDQKQEAAKRIGAAVNLSLKTK